MALIWVAVVWVVFGVAMRVLTLKTWRGGALRWVAFVILAPFVALAALVGAVVLLIREDHPTV